MRKSVIAKYFSIHLYCLLILEIHKSATVQFFENIQQEIMPRVRWRRRRKPICSLLSRTGGLDRNVVSEWLLLPCKEERGILPKSRVDVCVGILYSIV